MAPLGAGTGPDDVEVVRGAERTEDLVDFEALVRRLPLAALGLFFAFAALTLFLAFAARGALLFLAMVIVREACRNR